MQISLEDTDFISFERVLSRTAGWSESSLELLKIMILYLLDVYSVELLDGLRVPVFCFEEPLRYFAQWLCWFTFPHTVPKDSVSSTFSPAFVTS